MKGLFYNKSKPATGSSIACILWVPMEFIRYLKLTWKAFSVGFLNVHKFKLFNNIWSIQTQENLKSITMVLGLCCWIPIARVLGSKPPSGSEVDSVFHSSEVDQISTANPRGLMVKSKVSPRKGSAVLRQLNPIHERES